MQLKIEPQDLYFFDFYLRELLIAKPVNSLRSHGSPTEKPEGYQLIYEVTITENGKKTVFEIKLIFTQHKILPLIINAIEFNSIEEKDLLMKMLVSRITEAERKSKEKPMKHFEYEAHLSTGFYPIKSTIKFGKYKLSPLDERSEEGWLCKLRYPVEAINKDDSLTRATVEAKHIAAFLSLIFCVLVRFQNFSDITEDKAPKINFKEIDRPDLRPVKHPFAGELKIPDDFVELWTNFEMLPQDIRAAFISSCVCFQVAKEMNMKNRGIAYLIFVTAIEVISKKVIESRKPTTRFKKFLSQSLGRSDSAFFAKVGRFYYMRSNILHNEGVGLGFIPIYGIIAYDVVSGVDLWRLEIFVNAALIGLLEKPEIFGVAHAAM